jgi:hypothetical protein
MFKKLLIIGLLLTTLMGGVAHAGGIKVSDLAKDVILGDSGIYDFIYYNWQNGLAYFNNSVPQWLIGGTATSTDSDLEVQGSVAADEYCLDTSSPDCITSWASFDADNWTINGSGQLTPTTTIDLLSSGNFITSVIRPKTDSTSSLQITKADGTTDIMSFDTTNNRVGINTMAPTDLFVVNGVARFTDTVKLADGTLAATSLAHRADENTGMYFPANDNISFVTASLDRMSINPTGEIITGVDWGAVATAGNTGTFRAGHAGTTGTDTVGGDLYLKSGLGNGAGTGSTLYFQTPTAGSSGTTQQSYGTRLSINQLGITANTSINAGVNSISGGTGTFDNLNVDFLNINDQTITAVGRDLYLDNGNVGTYLQASSQTKASAESTGFHIGIHDSGAGTSTYVPLFLYDNYGSAVKFQTVKMASSGGYNLIFDDHTTATEDFYTLVTSLSANPANSVPFFQDDTTLISDAGLTYDKASQKFVVGTSAVQGSLGLVNSTRTTFLNAPATNQTITLPSTPVATSALNINSSGVIGTVTNTGSGNNVLATSPAITTPSVTTSILLTRTALGSTPNYGYYARNTTASTAIAPVQFSPAVQFFGTGWDSDGAGFSEGRTGMIYMSTASGADVTSQMRFDMDEAGGGSDTKMWLTNSGHLGLNGASNPQAILSIGANGVANTGLYVGGTHSYKQAVIADSDAEEMFGVSGNIFNTNQLIALGDINDAYAYTRFEVTSSTASLYYGDLRVLSDTNKLKLGLGGDIELYHNGTNSYLVNNTGDFKFQGDLVFENSGSGLPFGEIYVKDNSTSQAVANATVEAVEAFVSDGSSNLTTNDSANNRITALRAGKYLVNVSGVGGGDTGVTWDLAVGTSTSALSNNLHTHHVFTGTSERQTINMSGIISLSSSDNVQLFVSHTGGVSKDFLAEDLNLTITQIGS